MTVNKTEQPNGQSEMPDIFIKTPLIESVVLRKYTSQRPVYLKLENCQPSGSFKLRGLSNLCKFVLFLLNFSLFYSFFLH